MKTQKASVAIKKEPSLGGGKDILVSEHLTGFMAWLAGREEVVPIGGGNDWVVWHRLIEKYCIANDLPLQREEFAHPIVYPDMING